MINQLSNILLDDIVVVMYRPLQFLDCSVQQDMRIEQVLSVANGVTKYWVLELREIFQCHFVFLLRTYSSTRTSCSRAPVASVRTLTSWLTVSSPASVSRRTTPSYSKCVSIRSLRQPSTSFSSTCCIASSHRYADCVLKCPSVLVMYLDCWCI